MHIAFLIGRVIVALYFLESAWNHLAHSGHMIGYAQSKGVPSPKLAIMGSGVLLLLGGLSILTGMYTGVGLALLIIFLVVVSFKMHDYWKESDPMAKNGSRLHFYKNMAIIGALLMMYAIAGPWVW